MHGVMEEPRRPIEFLWLTSGDLDGRIFTLSPDGAWLLFSRSSTRPIDEEINNLWLKNIRSFGIRISTST